jgi:hypothetical protein
MLVSKASRDKMAKLGMESLPKLAARFQIPYSVLRRAQEHRKIGGAVYLGARYASVAEVAAMCRVTTFKKRVDSTKKPTPTDL